MERRRTKILLWAKYSDHAHKVFHRLRDDLAQRDDLEVHQDLQMFSVGFPEILIHQALTNAFDYNVFLHSESSPDDPSLTYAVAENSASNIVIALIGEQAPAFLQKTGYIDFVADYERGVDSILRIFGSTEDKELLSFDLDPGLRDLGIAEVSIELNRRLVEYFAAHPDELKKVNHRLFEEFVAELFSGFGYEVELTKPTQDGGKDVVAVKRAEVGVRYLIECKRPKQGRVIGVEASSRALCGEGP